MWLKVNMASDVIPNSNSLFTGAKEDYSGDCQDHAESQTENKMPSESPLRLTPSLFKYKISARTTVTCVEIGPQSKYAKKEIYN